MGSTTGAPEKRCDAVTHTRTWRHIVAPSHARRNFSQSTRHSSVAASAVFAAFGLQTAFSKAVSKRGKERRDVPCQGARGTDTGEFSAQEPPAALWDTLLLLLIQTTQLPRF